MSRLPLLLALCCAAPASAAGKDAAPESLEDRGDFLVEYDAAPGDYAELQDYYKRGRLFEDISAELNASLRLPFDITIALGRCGTANAFYLPKKRTIALCYELTDSIGRALAPYARDEDDLEEATLKTALFLFFHELGHALIHAFELPVIGREEDAVDEIAALILLDSGEHGERAVLDGASWFVAEGAGQRLKDLAFWDEHGLDLQRAYSLMCLAYGRDPDKHRGLVERGLLPRKRAKRCPRDFARKSKSWAALLEPHEKAPQGPKAAGRAP